MKQNKAIFSKWILSGLDGYVIGSDNEIYRLPFKSGRNYFGLRRLKMQHPNRWYINGKYYSKRQLMHKLDLNPNPEILIHCKDVPF